MLFGFFYGLIAATSLRAAELVDFDKMISDFILEERQIVIPGHPFAFNPSILRWVDGKLLLSFRERDPSTGVADLIGFVWLDADFHPVGEASFLMIHRDIPLKISKAQGARIFQVGNIFCIAYNNIISDSEPETRRMIVAHLNYKNRRFFIRNPEFILDYKGDPSHWREKNWSPFDCRGYIHFSYSLNPHRVFKLPKFDNTCATVGLTEANIDWPWGEMRGGSPALFDEDHYLGFFHSWKDLKSVQSNGEKISHYFMGAYRHKKAPPFEITHVSENPIIGKTFFHAPEYPTWKPLKVIYPGGHIFDKKFIWVVYGRQDHECWLVKLDKKALLKSLVPVDSPLRESQ